MPSAERNNLPVATVAAAQVMCLPIYPALSEGNITKILSIISNI